MELYDVMPAVLFALALGSIVYQRVRANKRRAVLEAARILYDTAIENVKLAFSSRGDPLLGLPLFPNPLEISVVLSVHHAILATWPEYVERIHAREWHVWFVRSADQPVTFRNTIGVAWSDVPAMNGIPESRPGLGYGGMIDGNDVYVATFHENRDPVALYCHELSHYATKRSAHDEVLAAAERKLYEAVKASGA